MCWFPGFGSVVTVEEIDMLRWEIIPYYFTDLFLLLSVIESQCDDNQPVRPPTDVCNSIRQFPRLGIAFTRVKSK